jgi:hypothetical protein
MELDPIFELGLKVSKFEKMFLKGSKIGRIRFKAPPNNLYINFIMSKLGSKLFFQKNNYTIMLTTTATQELYVVAKQKKTRKIFVAKEEKELHRSIFHVSHDPITCGMGGKRQAI